MPNTPNNKLVIVFCFNSSAEQPQMFKEINAKYDLINDLSLVKQEENSGTPYSFIEVKAASNQKQLFGLIENNNYRKEIEVIFPYKERYDSGIVYFIKLLGKVNSTTIQSNDQSNTPFHLHKEIKPNLLSSIEVNVKPDIKVSYYIPDVYKEVNGFKFNLSYYKEFIGFIIQGNFFPIIKGEEPSPNLGITKSSNNSIKFKKALYTLNPSLEQVNYFIKSVLGLKLRCTALTLNKFIKEHSVVINDLHYVKMTDLYSFFKDNHIL